MLEPSNAIPHLQSHLNTETEHELQMGAISGLADIRHPEALNILNTSTPILSEPNRTLANKGIEKLKQLFDMK
jgi:hypothetical protein